MLDTGAATSRVTTVLEAMGPPIERSGQKVASHSTGGVLIAERSVRALGFASADLHWSAPVLITAPTIKPASKDIGSFGTVAMDFVRGRRIAIDRPQRQMLIDREALLPAWPVGAMQRLIISGEDFDPPIEVRERVMLSGDDGVQLEVEISGSDPLQILVPDDHESRGAWLVTRKVRDKRKLEPLAKLLTPFKMTGDTAFEVFEEDGVVCTRVISRATTGDRRARASLVDCPARTWQKQSVTLTASDGSVIWKMEQAPAK